MILHEEEVPQGYPAHIRRARGHLCEAGRECLALYPGLAHLLRTWRKALHENPAGPVPDYDGILDYVETLVALDGQSRVNESMVAERASTPEIPRELYPKEQTHG
jgi:hypothetical protein